MKQQKDKIKSLLYEIELAEKAVLKKWDVNLDDWNPPTLTFIDKFHEKNLPIVKSTHPDYYRQRKEEAYSQEISILQTQLRIAKGFLNSEATFETGI